MTQANNIYLGDCLDIMKDIPDGSIDLILTDPPYRTTSRGNTGTMKGYWKDKLARSGRIFQYNDISCNDYLPHFFRILKDKTLCYVMCNNKNLQQIINKGVECGFHFVKCLIWEKGNKICGTYYMGCFEYIVLFRKGGDRPINDCGTPDILKIPIKKMKDKNGRNLHDTEKPVGLMQIIISNSSNDGDTVLDPFAGSGTTGVACKNLNRNYILIEKEEKYYNIIKDRLNYENI